MPTRRAASILLAPNLDGQDGTRCDGAPSYVPPACPSAKPVTPGARAGHCRHVPRLARAGIRPEPRATLSLGQNCLPGWCQALLPVRLAEPLGHRCVLHEAISLALLGGGQLGRCRASVLPGACVPLTKELRGPAGRPSSRRCASLEKGNRCCRTAGCMCVNVAPHGHPFIAA